MVFKKRKLLILLITSLFVVILNAHPVIGAISHDSLFVLIGDSLMKAKDGDREAVAKNIQQLEAEWKKVKTSSKSAKNVDEKLKKVQNQLAQDSVNTEALTKDLSALSTAVVQYDQEQNPPDKAKQKREVKQLIPLIKSMQDSIEAGKMSVLNGQYQSILNQWNASEKIVHDESVAAYGEIEKYMALIRIAITQNPADLGKAQQNLEALNDVLDNFLSGKAPKQVQGNYELEDLLNLLSSAEKQISGKEYVGASNQLNKALTIWPMVEGDVQTRDPQLYSDIETKIPTTISLLNSEQVDEKRAKDIVKNLNSRLASIKSKTSYSTWDAGLILLREGFEALLIVTTLLSFLKKIGEERKQKWIWSGVAAGILASIGLSLFINIVFSQMTAALNREYIEGITGITAVVMMLTVGVWLHRKSNADSWNKYVKKQMNQAIAKGSLMSFAFVSFLSIFREGAETIIFYAGIAPDISLQQLLTGIGLAALILIIAGFLIIHYSVKIPVGLFFRIATIFIYLIAFKILGVSIHALQVSKVLSTHTVEFIPLIDWIGIYPTWETAITQLLLLILIFFIVLMNRNTQTVKILSH